MATTAGIDARFRSIRPEEVKAWAQMCEAGFEGQDNAEYFTRHFHNDPFADSEGIFVAEADGRMVSSVRVFSREIYLDGRRFAMGGIGEVCTLRDYRQRGLSGALLRMAVEYMVRRDMPVSMLFTGTNHHYARYGWFTVPGRFAVIDLEDVADDRVRPMLDGDYAALRGLYGLFAGGLNGALVREHPDYWDRWVRSEWKAPMVKLKGEMPVAYLDAVRDTRRGGVWIRDFAQAPGEDALLPLLAAAARAQGTEMRASVPVALLHADPGAFWESTGLMMRINRPFQLGDKRIERARDLIAAMADAAFFEVDGF